MPPRGLTNPAPKTESAREARKSFFCELCSKGYSRMNEYEAHESSYDHQHKKRLKEMKQMQRDPLASAKARKAERRADERSGLITIKPVKLEGQVASASGAAAASATGFRKGGFRNAFGEGARDGGDGVKEVGSGGGVRKGAGGGSVADQGLGLGPGVADSGMQKVDGESDTEDEGYEYYDPRRPTGCWEGCPGRGS